MVAENNDFIRKINVCSSTAMALYHEMLATALNLIAWYEVR